MIRNGIGNIRNDAARRQLEVAAGVRREELNNQAAAMGRNMMAQAEMLPAPPSNIGGILASSPELQQTAMAMANGGPVQRFQNGSTVNAPLNLNQFISRLVTAGIPKATAQRLGGLQLGAGNITPNNPGQRDAEIRLDEFSITDPGFVDAGLRLNPSRVDPGFTDAQLTIDESSITDPGFVDAGIKIQDQVGKPRSGISTLLSGTGSMNPADIERPKETEDFLPTDITDPIKAEDFSQRFLPVTGARQRGFTQKYSPFVLSTYQPGTPTKRDPRVVALERDLERERIALALADEQENFDAQQEQSALDQGSTLEERAARLVSGNQLSLDAALDKRERDKTKSAQLGQVNKARKNPINSTRAAKAAENSMTGKGGDASTDALPDSDTEKNENPEKSLKDTVTSLFKLDSKETGNIILEAVGEKKEEKLEDRIKKYKKIAEDIFGEDIEGEKTERAYNLAFLGFAIAAGDSPNALSNISKGLLSATKKFNDSAERKRRRKQKIKEFALSESLKDERDQKKFLRDTALQRDRLANRLEVAGINNTASAKIAAGRTYAQLLMNAEQIKSAQKIANDREASADARQAAVNKINRLKLERQGIPKFQLGLAAEFKNRKGRDIRPEDFDTKEFDKIKKDYTETFKSFQNLKQSAASMALGDKAQTDNFVQRNFTELRRLTKKQLGLKSGQEPTPEEVRAFAGRFIREVKPTQRISIDAKGNERT